MREMLRLQARYNQFANNNMLAVLQTLSPSDLQKDVGVYYTSISGTFAHILEGDIAILLGIINIIRTKSPRCQVSTRCSSKWFAK